ncbi:hypothetical protein J7T55_000269 [Diaporthe amygdali]|uniref:uncharacterized protein n=1 Tax=Phomopsis amygdali TaxID=1214568 RepID=UPI0022FF2AAA|nr:uncharacterized protein J7T55_000269 [Diaporthe amygdali]KAJ0109344.1 hypothetical protein J7T55_000269 [Diaporthe amygdali]
MADEQFSLDWKLVRDEIIAALADELNPQRHKNHFEVMRGFKLTNGHLPAGADCVWIKYDFDVPRLQWQANTQAWAYEQIAKDDNANARFHIPRVCDFFEARINGLDYGLIVMEFVEGVTVSDIEFNITSSNISQEEKQNKLCPYGGGLITNLVWGREDSNSPQEYESVEDLQNWINAENDRTNPGYPPVDLVSEDLRLCFGDMNLTNFIMEDEDPSSRLIIIDFEHANFLPTSFLVYSSWLTHDAHISEGIRIRAHLQVNEDTNAALDNIRRHRPY